MYFMHYVLRTFDLFVHFFQSSWKSKMAGHRLKRSEIWDSGVLAVYMYHGVPLKFVVFNVILASFGTKWLDVEETN